MTRNPPPKLGGGPARTKSEQAGWFPCRYWQLREPPRPRLRSATPPNLGGVAALQFIHSFIDRRYSQDRRIKGVSRQKLASQKRHDYEQKRNECIYTGVGWRHTRCWWTSGMPYRKKSHAA